MAILKPVLILVILSSAMLYSNALATEPPPRVGASADLAKSAPTVPKKKAVQRRSVRQVIDPVTRAPPAPAYSPRLHPAWSPPPSPLILNGCNGGACTDANGERYHGGVGTTLISPQGRLCSNNGITVQCF
jgi:hypothetical protein